MIAILRLGHRIARDKRITTHVALVARTFGADAIYITTKDDTIENNLRSISTRFGGDFKIESGIKPKKFMKEWNGPILHLTMYGERLKDALPKIDTKKDILIVVGAEKVPAFVYELATHNIAVGNQPHSEVAALALMLDRLTKGRWENFEQPGGMVKIKPNPHGKTVIPVEDDV